jgi:hypothetical protein
MTESLAGFPAMPRLSRKGFPMENEGRQMPEHIKLAYEDAVNNMMFFKRQQWVATNYAILVYAAIFVISAEYFSRTDFARNWLGIIAIATFFFHLYVIYSFDAAINKFRDRLDWIYRTYFSGEERANLKLFELRSPVDGVTLGLILVSFLGLLLTAIFLWSVR